MEGFNAPGFLLGTVLANNDREKKGLLKIRLLREGSAVNVLEGVKLVTPFAGDGYGCYALPEIGEQVLVGFLGGSYDRPFVLGSLYAVGDGMLSDCFTDANAVKKIKTKAGAVIEISDVEGKEAIRVGTPGGLSVTLEDKGGSVVLTTDDATLTLDGKKGKVTLNGGKELSLESGQAKLTLKSNGGIKLEGVGIEIKGSTLKIESSGTLAVKGQKSELSGSLVDVKAQGILTLGGAMVKIN